jgi:enterochelin esterase-like enzyme
MGAWGALSTAFRYPEQFGVVGAHSVSLRADDGSVPFLGIGEEFAGKDPLSLARTRPNLDRLQIWIDMPSDDPWLTRAEQLHIVLSDRHISHIWQVLAGVHGYTYWEEHMLDYVRFYGRTLAPG